MAKILFIEDDTMLADMVSDILRKEGHEVDSTADGAIGYDKLHKGNYEIAIVDWHLPSKTGIEICRDARNNGSLIPILMLTNARGPADSESGLDSGADDYLTKPFNVLELLARIKALLRRPQRRISDQLQCGPIVLNLQTGEVFKDGVKLDLRHSEYVVFELLLRHRGTVFSSEEILDRAWSSEAETGFDAVSTCIKRLRAKLDGGTGSSSSIIKTIHAVGYLIE